MSRGESLDIPAGSTRDEIVALVLDWIARMNEDQMRMLETSMLCDHTADLDTDTIDGVLEFARSVLVVDAECTARIQATVDRVLDACRRPH
jgi:MinD-like ATPase involved in chromosome partitioning or flagellar assembly